MTTEQTADQLELAAKILRTGHPWEFESSNGQWGPPIAHGDIKAAVLAGYEIRLALATPPDNRPTHNPDNLDAETVGAGYRLLLPEELDGRHQNNCEVWNGKGAWSDEKPIYARYRTFSYRLPLSVPWPESPKPES